MKNKIAIQMDDINSIDFDLESFLKIKLKLISERIQSNEVVYFDEDLNIINEFSPISNLPGEKKYKFSIKGNPSLGKIKTITLGLKNPSTEIGKNLSGEVWFNELRLSEISGKGKGMLFLVASETAVRFKK